VPVYGGQFRIVQADIVLADITNQVEQGAQHVTFGDPDFFNGIGHAKRVIHLLHQRHPEITYDVTIKIEHLLQHLDACTLLKETGCLFVTSAVESIDDRVLQLLDKGHTRRDFLNVLRHFMTVGLTLNPTFIPFTPWISEEGYCDLLHFVADENLISHVAPIQLTMRLLIPAGSRLMELPEIRQCAGLFHRRALTYPWTHANAEVDKLQADLLKLVYHSERRGLGRAEIFNKIWRLTHESAHGASSCATPRAARATIPYLTEPWYC
jgi:hypothetical protein